MRWDTYIPCVELQPYISSMVVQETKDANTYKVVPGTSIVIGFQYKGQLSIHTEKGEGVLSSEGITGLIDTYRVFTNSPDIGTVLVYFKESGAASFFKEPLHELFRQSLSLDHFMLRSELLLLQEQLQAAQTDRLRITVIERFLLSRLKPVAPDPLVMHALALIHQQQGDVRIHELIQQLHTSQSPLEKRFRKVVGTSPKKFASLVRLQYLLQTYQPGTSLTATAYDAGYYDQAHFIKEFRSFTGDTPESYFKRDQAD